MRVLFGIEFSGGFGHHARVLAIESALRARLGNLSSLIVGKPQGSEYLTSTAWREVRVAPELAIDPDHKRHDSRFLCHRIAARWLLLQDLLTARLRLWQTVISDFQPDVVVAEAAPSLCLAARGQVPCVASGNGATLPPALGRTCTAYRKPRPGDADDATFTDDFWLSRINEVLCANGITPLESLPQINRADAHALFTIPLFDVYWQERTADYLGPLHPGGSPRPAAAMGEHAICYFSADYGTPLLLDGLVRSGIPIIAHVPGDVARNSTRVAGSKVVLHESRFDLARAMPAAGLAIHAGSLGMSSAALYAGIPQLALSQHDEGLVNGRSLRLSRTGSAAPLVNCNPERIAELVRTAYRNTEMRDNALALSERYAAFRDGDPAAKAADIILRLAGKG